MEKLKVVIAHPGTQHAPKLARELEKQGFLSRYVSTLIWSYDSFFIRFLKKISSKSYLRLSNRVLPGVPSRKISTHPSLELIHWILKQFKKNLTDNQLFYLRNKNFQEKITLRDVADAQVIIGFDTSSWLLVNFAKKNNLVFILDQSIGHSREIAKVYKSLNLMYPEWAKHITEKEPKHIEFEDREYETADYIVAATTFSKETLLKNGVDANKIFLNPYGVDLAKFSYKPKVVRNRKVFLFVGIVDVRKGIPFLLECWKKANLTNCELWIVGPVADEVRTKLEVVKSITVFGKIINAQLPALMSKADVFVFPSFFEGFGLVILEAMACGLPVITTTATAGPDLIENYKDGFVFSPGAEKDFIESFHYFHSNPEETVIMGKNARLKAEKYSWTNYGIRWGEIINSAVGSNVPKD